jgi:hypothetical protein
MLNSLVVKLQEHLSVVFDELASKLNAARKQMVRVLRKSRDNKGAVTVRREKYAAIKGSIDQVINQLGEWQHDFDTG